MSKIWNPPQTFAEANGTQIPESAAPSGHGWQNAEDFGELAAFAEDIAGMGPNDTHRSTPAFAETARCEAGAYAEAVRILHDVREALQCPYGTTILDHARRVRFLVDTRGGNLSVLSRDLEKLREENRELKAEFREGLKEFTALAIEVRGLLEAPVGKDILEHVRFIMETRAEYLGRMRRFENDRDAARASEGRQRAIVAALKNDVDALGRKLDEKNERLEAVTEAAFEVVGRFFDEGTAFDAFLEKLGQVTEELKRFDPEQAKLFLELLRIAFAAIEEPEEPSEPTRHGTDSVYG